MDYRSGKKYHRKVIIVATNKTENIKKAQQIYYPKKFQYRFVFLNPGANSLELDEKNIFYENIEYNVF